MPQEGQPARCWRKNCSWCAADTTIKCRGQVSSASGGFGGVRGRQILFGLGVGFQAHRAVSAF